MHTITGAQVYLTVRQFAAKHSFLTESALRYIIFNEHENGFSRCVLRVGRKVLIDENAVFEWLKNQSRSILSVGG